MIAKTLGAPRVKIGERRENMRRGRLGASTPVAGGLCTPQSDLTGEGVVTAMIFARPTDTFNRARRMAA